MAKQNDVNNKMVSVIVTEEVAGFIESLREKDEDHLKEFTDALSDLTLITFLHKEEISSRYYERLDRSLIYLSYINDYLSKMAIPY